MDENRLGQTCCVKGLSKRSVRAVLENGLMEFNGAAYYHMSYALTRTSMALDEATLTSLAELAKKEAISKAEVMRRAIKYYKEDSDRRTAFPQPEDALAWLQNGGGLTLQEASDFRDEMHAERRAKVYWWEVA